jgi:outer membrane protein assembly factor BamE (lipoprotein component of BamABCDE complex)
MQARAIGGIVTAVWMLMACEPIVNHRGHVAEEKITEKVVVGQTSREEVMEIFGSPSSISNFGDETWYYIQVRKEAKAFLRPEITEQDVVRVVFDNEGTVKDVHQYGKEDAQDVAIVDDVTPTEGHSMGFFEQVFGNIGRFNKDREVDPNRPRR